MAFQVAQQELAPPPAGALLAVEITFVPPTRQLYDRDNLLARIKGGIDGLFDVWGMRDDVLQGPMLLHPLRAPQGKNARVLMRLSVWKPSHAD